VVAMLRANLNKVVNSKTAGKVENAKELGKYKDKITNKQDVEILMAIKMSTSQIGRGIIIINTMAMMMMAAMISERLEAIKAMSDSFAMNFCIGFGLHFF
jgi:hypothetical protein